eukprot:6062872-Amphidinium_carterae.2
MKIKNGPLAHLKSAAAKLYLNNNFPVAHASNKGRLALTQMGIHSAASYFVIASDSASRKYRDTIQTSLPRPSLECLVSSPIWNSLNASFPS